MEPQMVGGHTPAVKRMRLIGLPIHKVTISLHLRAKLPNIIGERPRSTRSTSLFPISSQVLGLFSQMLYEVAKNV